MDAAHVRDTHEQMSDQAVVSRRVKKRRKRRRRQLPVEPIHGNCVAYTARRMLRDCELAIRSLPQRENQEALWRHDWFGAIALLRAIGHALKNEDTKRSEHLKEAVEVSWHRWKTDFHSSQIFHGFIETERNSLLKEYAFRNERKIYALEAGEGEDAMRSGR
jgi:hypothetical protein